MLSYCSILIDSWRILTAEPAVACAGPFRIGRAEKRNRESLVQEKAGERGLLSLGDRAVPWRELR